MTVTVAGVSIRAKDDFVVVVATLGMVASRCPMTMTSSTAVFSPGPACAIHGQIVTMQSAPAVCSLLRTRR